jgi:hypothetical protein
VADLVRRRLLFFIDVTTTGSVVARGLNNDIEIHAGNVADLRTVLAEDMGALGLEWRVVGVRTEGLAPSA